MVFPYGLLKPSKGIRQGLFPFSLWFRCTFRLLTQAGEEDRLHGVKITRESPPISHLIYVDDLVIFCRADEQYAKTAVGCMTNWLGLVES